jgi:hypothetical protein
MYTLLDAYIQILNHQEAVVVDDTFEPRTPELNIPNQLSIMDNAKQLNEQQQRLHGHNHYILHHL